MNSALVFFTLQSLQDQTAFKTQGDNEPTLLLFHMLEKWATATAGRILYRSARALLNFQQIPATVSLEVFLVGNWNRIQLNEKQRVAPYTCSEYMEISLKMAFAILAGVLSG